MPYFIHACGCNKWDAPTISATSIVFVGQYWKCSAIPCQPVLGIWFFVVPPRLKWEGLLVQWPCAPALKELWKETTWRTGGVLHENKARDKHWSSLASQSSRGACASELQSATTSPNLSNESQRANTKRKEKKRCATTTAPTQSTPTGGERAKGCACGWGGLEEIVFNCKPGLSGYLIWRGGAAAAGVLDLYPFWPSSDYLPGLSRVERKDRPEKGINTKGTLPRVYNIIFIIHNYIQ